MHPVDETPTGWLYVIELRPSGRVKVGQTSSIAERLATHARTIGAGGYVGAVASFPVCHPRIVEQRLLDTIRTLPGVVPVEGANEVFMGTSFYSVMTLARDICALYAAVEVQERRDEEPLTPVQIAVLEIFDELGESWLPSSVLLNHLAGRGLEILPSQLGNDLGNCGSKRDWSGRRQLRGYAIETIKRELDIARTHRLVVPLGDPGDQTWPRA